MNLKLAGISLTGIAVVIMTIVLVMGQGTIKTLNEKVDRLTVVINQKDGDITALRGQVTSSEKSNKELKEHYEAESIQAEITHKEAIAYWRSLYEIAIKKYNDDIVKNREYRIIVEGEGDEIKISDVDEHGYVSRFNRLWGIKARTD